MQGAAGETLLRELPGAGFYLHVLTLGEAADEEARWKGCSPAPVLGAPRRAACVPRWSGRLVLSMTGSLRVVSLLSPIQLDFASQTCTKDQMPVSLLQAGEALRASPCPQSCQPSEEEESEFLSEIV